MLYMPSNDIDIWGVHDVYKAFQFYTRNRTILAEHEELGFQGDFNVVFEHQGWIFIWRGGFGTCDICDAIGGCNKEKGYQVIKNSLSEGNTLQFRTIDHARNYIKLCQINLDTRLKSKIDAWNWYSFPLALFDLAEDNLAKDNTPVYRDGFIKQILEAELEITEPMPLYEIKQLWDDTDE